MGTRFRAKGKLIAGRWHQAWLPPEPHLISPGETDPGVLSLLSQGDFLRQTQDPSSRAAQTLAQADCVPPQLTLKP